MSLRNALAALSDDRATHVAVGEILSYFKNHSEEADAAQIARITGTTKAAADRILGVLAEGLVLDCLGDPPRYRYHPDTVNDLEVSRYLRRRSSHDSKIQGSVDRFRSQFGGR